MISQNRKDNITKGYSYNWGTVKDFTNNFNMYYKPKAIDDHVYE